MTQKREWYKRQSEHCRHFYECIAADYDDLADWKTTVAFYSALHRVNYYLDALTGRAPKSRFERNRLVRRELPAVSDDYHDLYRMSKEARYCEGFRLGDARSEHAARLWAGLRRSFRFRKPRGASAAAVPRGRAAGQDAGRARRPRRIRAASACPPPATHR